MAGRGSKPLLLWEAGWPWVTGMRLAAPAGMELGRRESSIVGVVGKKCGALLR